MTIPSATGLNHIGYNVPDLDAALAFFVDVLGFEVQSRHGPMAYSDDCMRRWFDVDPRASVRFAFLCFIDGTRVELAEWRCPDQIATPASSSDVSGRHLALSVTDLEAAIAYVQAQPNVTVHEQSNQRFVFFSTPWGMNIQLVQTEQATTGTHHP
jgi:catechol 2,3-dioxygenase-like lactoylglutathione lyase family enzyme